MVSINPTLTGSLALFYSGAGLPAPVWPTAQPPTNAIVIPAFVTLPYETPTRFLTSAEQQELVTALRASGRVKTVLKSS
jgi:hypothetical protein